MLKLLISATAALACLAAPPLARPRPRLVWNASASVPIGLYTITAMARPRNGALALIAPPPPLSSFLALRGYIAADTPILKRIVATEGMTVCRHDRRLSVEGATRGIALMLDQRGRPLPVWSGCLRLARGQIFVLNENAPASFDGRYFGPLPVSAIIGRATPTWLLREHR